MIWMTEGDREIRDAKESNTPTSEGEQSLAPTLVADPVLLNSLEVALAALREITPESTIGASAGHRVEGEHVLSLLFECTMLGYPDWYWTVTMARVANDSEPSVLETELLPGESSVLSPDWVPWSERLAEYQALQEAAKENEAERADDEDDDEEEEELDDRDIDGVDIDSMQDDEEIESDDITGVELATLDLEVDEPDRSEPDSAQSAPKKPRRARRP